MLLNGRLLSRRIRSQLASRIVNKRTTPRLAIIQVGDDPASTVYTGTKMRLAKNTGIATVYKQLPTEFSTRDIKRYVQTLNDDPGVHGIIVQLPLPDIRATEDIVQSIAVEKDVDGFTYQNTHRLMARNCEQPLFIPCTPLGIITLLQEYNIPITGTKSVVVGNSNIVGMPMSHLLLRNGSTVTTCHSKTKCLEDVCRQADILVTATGVPGLIQPHFIKPGATVIDVGISRVGDTIVGDTVDANIVAGSYTPVPGGVGPMTVAMLLSNTVDAWIRQN